MLNSTLIRPDQLYRMDYYHNDLWESWYFDSVINFVRLLPCILLLNFTYYDLLNQNNHSLKEETNFKKHR